MLTTILIVALVLSLLANCFQQARIDHWMAQAKLLQLHLESHVCRPTSATPTLTGAPPGCIEVRVSSGGSGGGLAGSRVVEDEDAWLAPILGGARGNADLDFDLTEKTQPNLTKRT